MSSIFFSFFLSRKEWCGCFGARYIRRQASDLIGNTAVDLNGYHHQSFPPFVIRTWNRINNNGRLQYSKDWGGLIAIVWTLYVCRREGNRRVNDRHRLALIGSIFSRPSFSQMDTSYDKKEEEEKHRQYINNSFFKHSSSSSSGSWW